MAKFIWQSEHIDALKLLWRNGHSASECARELGSLFGQAFSRCSVLGKLHRMNVTRGKKMTRPHQKHLRRPKRRATSDGRTPPPTSVPTSPPLDAIDFVDLNADTCRFPYGKTEFKFCGKPTCDRALGVYCEEHADIAYAPFSTRPRVKRNHNYGDYRPKIDS